MGPQDAHGPTDAPKDQGAGADGDAMDEDPTVGSDLDALRDEVAALSHHVADLTDKLLRARADYDNLQKRVAREAALERDRVRARVLERFLPVFEYARMAQAAAAANPGPVADGVRMVTAEFERLLTDEGVVPIGKEGEPFDATRHEAVGDEDGPAGKVVRVVAPGYLLGERVLRYAKVTVGAGPDQAGAP